MIGLEAAHYEMLAELHQKPSPFAESFLQAVFASAERQLRADQEHHVPWNRHFLACLRRTLETPLLAGARAVNTAPTIIIFLPRPARGQFRVRTELASTPCPSSPLLLQTS
jgi:hypothetical protein